MSILKRIHDSIKFLMASSNIPFVRNSADRNNAERFFKSQHYKLAYNLYRRTEQHAKDNNLVFDELISLLKLRDILIVFLGDDHQDKRIQVRLSELEIVLDNSDESSGVSLASSYSYTPTSSLDEKVIANILWGYYYWFKEESQKATSNLQYHKAILCAKAARRFCMEFQFLSYVNEIESLFSLGVIYGHIRNTGMALRYYNEALTVASAHRDIVYEFVSISRKLTFLLVISHIDKYLDFDKERDSVLSLLVEKIGDRSLDEYRGNLIELERHSNDIGLEERVGRIEEAVANLELLLSLKSGDIVAAQECVQKIDAAEIKAYGAVSHAENLIDFYQMLFSSPERELFGQEENTTDDPHLVPDIPSTHPLSFRFTELLKLMTNCTINHWHNSAQAIGSDLLALAIESKSDYHICMANYMIARDLSYSGKNEEALKLYKETLSFLLQANSCLTSDANLSPYMYYAINMSIGDILCEMSPYQAIDYFNNALLYLEKENSNHLLLEIELRTSHAISLNKTGQKDIAEIEFITCLYKLTEAAINRLPYLTGDERENLWGHILFAFKRVLANLRNDSGADFRRAAYNAVLFSKGFLLITEKSIQTIVSESNMQRALDLYRLCIKKNAQVGTWGTSHCFSPNQYSDKYLNDIRLQLEIKSALSEASVNQQDIFSIISSSLVQKTVIVDYFDTIVRQNDGNPQYLAFLIKPDQDAPDVIDVFPESSLFNLFSQMKTDGVVQESAIYDSQLPYGDLLLKTIWMPLMPQLLDCDCVYFCPAGSLNKIALDCLPYENGVLADYFSGKFYRISHAREVRTLKNGVHELIKEAIFLGGLDYDPKPLDTPNKDNNPKSRGNYVVNHVSEKHHESTLIPWGYLRWSEREVDMCKGLWERLGKKVFVFKGHNGNVQVFEALSQGKTDNILHIATHGFSETINSAQMIPALADSYNPLQLTGLILSDGNKGWLLGNKTNHLGVLTAYDISNYNLHGTRLVVLSACFTGSGIVYDDGLYGLIRAFKKAGVKTIIASLWELNDKVACVFMYYFYLSFLIGGVDCREAFKQTRERVRSAYPDPLYWAGYVLID